MENTIVAKGRLEVRGGTLTVKKGVGNKPHLEIGPEITVIGRNEACDLVLDDKRVSAVHVELVATERGVRVRDLGSSTGTFRNERALRFAEALGMVREGTLVNYERDPWGQLCSQAMFAAYAPACAPAAEASASR